LAASLELIWEEMTEQRAEKARSEEVWLWVD
jgi:hypothetical protein